MGQIEFFTTRKSDRGAEHSSCVLEHEVHFLGCYFFGGNDEIAFVFAILIVNHDDEFPFFEVFYGSFDAAEFEVFHIPYYIYGVRGVLL